MIVLTATRPQPPTPAPTPTPVRPERGSPGPLRQAMAVVAAVVIGAAFGIVAVVGLVEQCQLEMDSGFSVSV